MRRCPVAGTEATTPWAAHGSGAAVYVSGADPGQLTQCWERLPTHYLSKVVVINATVEPQLCWIVSSTETQVFSPGRQTVLSAFSDANKEWSPTWAAFCFRTAIQLNRWF